MFVHEKPQRFRGKRIEGRSLGAEGILFIIGSRRSNRSGGGGSGGINSGGGSMSRCDSLEC